MCVCLTDTDFRKKYKIVNCMEKSMIAYLTGKKERWYRIELEE